MDRVKLSFHHLGCLSAIYEEGSNIFNYLKTFLELILEKKYNPYFTLKYVILAKKVRDNPNLEIEVVRRPDDICKNLCNQREDDCFEPRGLPSELQIRLNKFYKSGELFRIVKKYYESEKFSGWRKK